MPNDGAPAIQVGPDWPELAERAQGRTVLLVGPPGAGKSTLGRYLIETLAARQQRVARVSGDPGQPAFGPPGCVALSLGAEARVDAMWFVGSTTPARHLLPTVVGIGRLVERARAGGATSIVVDTSGLIAGQVARVLLAHTCLAAGATVAVAVGRHGELPGLGLLLERCAAEVLATVSPAARDRTAAERRTFREATFARYFARSARRGVDPARIVGGDWLPLPASEEQFLSIGTIAGLLDEAGFCRGIGVVVAGERGRIFIDTPVATASEATRVQLGSVRLDPAAGYREVG